MDSSNQTSWPPFQPPQDCSQGFCSIYCPQWCYFLFPPPPSFDPSDSAPAISPLGIALIALAAAAFVLFSYYAIIHRHCRRRRSSHPIAAAAASAADAAQDPSPSDGLDDALISKITVHRYRRGDALVAATNCSVCLCEFRDDEGLRLLPKCNHAFHIPCIDTWLKSHPNCPLCRAGIVWPGPPPAEEAPIQVVIQESQTSSLVAAEQGPVKGIDGVSSSSMNHARGRSGVLPL